MALDNYGRTTYGGGGAETSGFGRTPAYSGTTATDALQALIGAERGTGARRYPSERFERAKPTLGGTNAADQQLADMERAARIKQIQAAMRPAPQRLVTGSNIIPGYVDDPSQMNAYQRQLYLPQSSQANPVADAQAEAMRGEEQRRADEAFSAMVQRRRATDAMGGGPSYGRTSGF